MLAKTSAHEVFMAHGHPTTQELTADCTRDDATFKDDLLGLGCADWYGSCDSDNKITQCPARIDKDKPELGFVDSLEYEVTLPQKGKDGKHMYGFGMGWVSAGPWSGQYIDAERPIEVAVHYVDPEGPAHKVQNVFA